MRTRKLLRDADIAVLAICIIVSFTIFGFIDGKLAVPITAGIFVVTSIVLMVRWTYKRLRGA